LSSTPIACPGCDSLYRIDPDASIGTAECPRCGAVLWREGSHSLDTTLALVLAALFLFLMAQLFPLLTLRLHGTVQEASLPACT
jgi:paraquat-inducible protein A